MDCNQVFWGTKTIYLPLQQAYKNPPSGYDPVFINYVGRHGARFQTSISSDTLLYRTLQIAFQENALTKSGIQLKRMDSLLINIEKENISLITGRGMAEQEGIGNRIAQNFKQVFQDKYGTILVSTTKKERTKQSARSFLKGLHPDTLQHIYMNFNNNDELAFYDVSPAYREFKGNGNWKQAFEMIQNKPNLKALYERVPQYFFTIPFIKKMNGEKQLLPLNGADFSKAFYDAASIIASLEEEIKMKGFTYEDLNMKSLISCEDLQLFNYVNCAEDFLLKGPGTDVDGIQVKIAAPLLLSFIASTDSFIQTKKIIANLCFGHAETIAPFAALLGIQGASEPVKTDKISEYNKSWACEKIIPLSSNIQWILYKNKNTSDYIIKLLLNEKEVTISNLKDIGTPCFYSWKSVKAYYLDKLNRIGLHPNDDIHQFLLKVQ